MFNILLQVFEDGQLTDGLGNTVDFKNTIIIMTSNIGARHLQRREGLGFQSSKEDMISDKVEELVKGEVKRTFNPEFLNRLDEVIIFNALSEGDLIQILELMVNQLNQNLAQKSITVSVADEAKKWILNQTLTDRTYGARPLRRALQKYIEDPLSEALIQGTINVAPRVHRGLPRRQQTVLPSGGLERERRRAAVREFVRQHSGISAFSRQRKAGGFCFCSEPTMWEYCREGTASAVPKILLRDVIPSGVKSRGTRFPQAV